MRLVSLTCSNTEIVAALGCGDQLVGVDDYSDYPPDVVAGLPRVGPDLGIDIEQVAALEPDLVLASLTVPGHEKIVAALEAAGLPHIAPEPTSIDDIYRDIEQIGERLGEGEKAAQVIVDLRRSLSPVPGSSGMKPVIAVEWWPKPAILPGGASWVSDLIERAGGTSPLAAEPVKSRPVSDEELAEINPDAIVLSWCGVAPEKYRPEVIYANRALADVRAVREQRVVSISEQFLGRPSPLLAQGYAALVTLIRSIPAQPALPLPGH